MVQKVRIIIVVRYSDCEFVFHLKYLWQLKSFSIVLDMYQHHTKSLIGMSFIFINCLIIKRLYQESKFSIKHSINSVGVYKIPNFSFGNEICLSTFSIFIMDEAFLCRYFLLLFDVVFLIIESSLSRKLLQLNLDFFNALFLR